jgi:hypothetical protein
MDQVSMDFIRVAMIERLKVKPLTTRYEEQAVKPSTRSEGVTIRRHGLIVVANFLSPCDRYDRDGNVVAEWAIYHLTEQLIRAFGLDLSSRVFREAIPWERPGLLTDQDLVTLHTSLLKMQATL